MTLLKRIVSYEPAESWVTDSDLVTIDQAAKMLEMGESGVRSAIARGKLTEYVDDTKTWKARRLLLRSEVLAMMSSKSIDKDEGRLYYGTQGAQTAQVTKGREAF